MLRRADPSEVYRRVDFDARVTGASPQQLVDLCFEQLSGSLERAIFAEARGDNAMKSAALTRAVAALTALQLGVDGENPTGAALLQLYGSARRSVLDSAIAFDRATMEAIRSDFAEIGRAMRASAAA
ncbi:MAG: flagellar protein FliS [Sphingomonadales bacterium]|nr:flagellar protein FliS [Sphingomonadales bacterium]MDE2569055.1 flagellar protein FliS [Sphingomonadales bacterium]